jgi:DNA/RNA endonuclease YhcR with UshA esterase domain
MKDENKNFFLKTGTITAAALIVAFCVKLWIVDAFLSQRKQPSFSRSAIINGGVKTNWDKTKHVIDWRDASKHVGDYVEITGTIVASHKNDKICYLNFDRDYVNNVALIIFASNYERFPKDMEKYYLGKKLKVEGRIKEFKGRLEIPLDDTAQITAVK